MTTRIVELKAELVRLLEAEAGEWLYRKNQTSYDHNPDYWWELKAKAGIFGEIADSLENLETEGISTPEELMKAALATLNAKELGWGSNWSDDNHSYAIRTTRWKIESFFSTRKEKEGA